MKQLPLALFSAALLLCLFGTGLQAQTAPRQELGLQFSGINFDGSNQFNAIYKRQKKDNTYRRIRLAFGNLSVAADDNDNTVFNFSAGLAIGRERRKDLGRGTTFFRGLEYRANAAVAARNTNEDAFNLGAGIGYVLGLQHDFNDHWAVNVETIPGLSANFTDFGGNNFAASVSAGFSNAVSLAVMYKFGS